MATLGEDWKRRVSLNEDNRRVLTEGIARRELMAAQWVENAQRTELAEGIESCVSRGSDSLALPFPTEIVASTHLHSFIDSLKAEGLMVDVAVGHEGEQESLLLVAPM